MSDTTKTTEKPKPTNDTSIQTEEHVMAKMTTLPGGAYQIGDLLIAAEVLMELELEMVIDEDVAPELETENVDPDIIMEEDGTDDGTPVLFHLPPPPDLEMRQRVKRQLFKD